MSEDSEIKNLSDLAKVIAAEIGRLLGANITVAIVDADANIKYTDNDIQKFTDFIVSFTKGNFKLLSVGDHSLPLSGTNIAFFKISERAIIILNSDKGPVGQLLAFKGRMHKFSPLIDELLESMPSAEEKEVPAKAAARVPVLTVSIANKKFGMEEAKVLHLVNGENTISDICEKTKLPQLKVDEILRKYQKKRWIKLKRLIIGAPKPAAPYKSVKTKKEVLAAPPLPAISHAIPAAVGKESVYLFPILEGDFKAGKFPKKDSKILWYCDGQNTLDDIIRKTSLKRIDIMEVIKKYEKKKKLKLTKIIPPSAPAERVIPSPAPASPSSAPSAPTLPPERDSEEVVFDELLDIMDQTQPVFQGTSAPPPPNPVVPSIPPPAPQTPPPAAPLQTPPSTQNIEVSVIQGEPVTDALFDDLTNLLDDTAPVAPGQPAAPATPPVARPPQAPSTISSDSLLEETDEGIKITTYPEEDPLKNRLERLSTILDETTVAESGSEGKADVKIVGSKAICPHCKTHVIMMAKICPSCQRPLRTCPNCKSPITLFARICPSCGSLL